MLPSSWDSSTRAIGNVDWYAQPDTLQATPSRESDCAQHPAPNTAAWCILLDDSKQTSEFRTSPTLPGYLRSNPPLQTR
jgi:hypothetical protein